jgi:hypothetical protein
LLGFQFPEQGDSDLLDGKTGGLLEGGACGKKDDAGGYFGAIRHFAGDQLSLFGVSQCCRPV